MIRTAIFTTITVAVALTGVVPVANGQVAPVPEDPAADSEVQKWKTETARYEAEKAAWDAKLAALRAQIGEVPDSGYSGDVTVGAKASETEVALLAAKAVDEAAKNIAKKILCKANCKTTKQKKILLYTAAQTPDFQAYVAFETQLSVVGTVLDTALKKSEAVPKEKGVVGQRDYVAAAGLALSAANKILGYFRSGYAVAGVAMTFQDDSMLVHALAGKVAELGYDVQVPAVYNPAVHSASTSALVDKIIALTKKQHPARLNSKDHADAAESSDVPKEKKKHLEAARNLDVAVTLYDVFFSELTTATEGKIPLTNVILETALVETLKQDGQLLIVKIQKAGGAHYTKKNIGTLFGGMPFYHMGGAVVSFVLLNGASGSVEKSGVVPIHGGFVKANEVKKHLDDSTR